jgi:hypothetical protein
MKNANQPAHPIPVAANETGVYSTFDANVEHALTGLTKREYFAAKALQGLLANSNEGVILIKDTMMAMISVQMADKLLAELEK